MTISTTIIKNSYAGNASTTAFTYGFKISADSEMEVIIRSAAGGETVKTISTHYNVSGAGNAGGGTVTFTGGNTPASGETVILRRNTALTQTLDLIENDNLPANSIESGFDKNLALIQELQEELDRSIKISRTNTMTSTEFTVAAADRASKILAFDSSGEISVTQELGTYKGTDATTTTEAYNTRDLVKSTTAGQLNNVYICVATSVVGDTLTDTDHFALLVDAFASAASAATATTKANEAAASATTATNAKNAAETAESNAETAEAAAETAQAAAEAALDSFDDRYLGAKSSAPTVDNDGNALLTGALYFNSSTSQIFNWTAADAWEAIKPTSTEQTAINALAASAVVADMALLATTDIIADMALLANTDTIADMAILATTDVVADLNKLATTAIVEDLNILATTDIVADLAQLATTDFVADLTAIEAIKANVTTVAANVAGVTSFAERYRVGSSDPSSNNDAGDLFYHTGSSVVKFYNGSAWVTITSPQVSLAGTETLTNKTLTTPKINEDVALTATATELNLLDGVSGLVQADLTKLAAVDSTAAELNIIDGDTSATATTLADADRLVVNDDGTMKQVSLTNVKTYLNSAGYVTDDPTALAIALG